MPNIPDPPRLAPGPPLAAPAELTKEVRAVAADATAVALPNERAALAQPSAAPAAADLPSRPTDLLAQPTQPAVAASLGPKPHLEAEIRAVVEYSLKKTKAFGTVYYSMRVALIVLSVCAAAKGINFLAYAAPVLSLFVAIGTALDTWLKPGLRYKIHYKYHDQFRKLWTDIKFIKPEDVSALNHIKRKFQETDDHYRKEIFSV